MEYIGYGMLTVLYGVFMLILIGEHGYKPVLFINGFIAYITLMMWLIG